jgi:hypothetical protein
MATEKEKEPETGTAFTGQTNPYVAVAQDELDTEGSEWGGLLGFLAGAGAAIAALPTGGASLAAIPAILGAGGAAAELGSGIGGLADDDPRAGQRMISGTQNLSKAYKDKAFTGKK